MKRLHFTDIEKFGKGVVDAYYSYFDELDEDFTGISVVAHYDIIRDFVNWLVKNTDFELRNIVLEEGEAGGYYDEWLLTIDAEGEICIQEAKYDTGYVYEDRNLTYVHGGVNSAFVVRNKNYEMVMFEIGEDYDDEEDEEKICSCGKCTAKKSEEKSSFTVKVNGNEITDAKEKAKYLDKALLTFYRRNNFWNWYKENSLFDGWKIGF